MTSAPAAPPENASHERWPAGTRTRSRLRALPASWPRCGPNSTRRPLIRDLVARRRERIVTVAAVLLSEGIAAGDLPPSVQVERTARALADLLDGIVLECLSASDVVDGAEVERRAMLLLPDGLA